MSWTWNDTMDPQCSGSVSGKRLTWAWWRPRTGSPHSWGGCCPSCPCLSPWTLASWTGAECTPGWSGPVGCRVVRLAWRSGAPSSPKTGGSDCSPSERGLERRQQRTDTQDGSEFFFFGLHFSVNFKKTADSFWLIPIPIEYTVHKTKQRK